MRYFRESLIATFFMITVTLLPTKAIDLQNKCHNIIFTAFFVFYSSCNFTTSTETKLDNKQQQHCRYVICCTSSPPTMKTETAAYPFIEHRNGGNNTQHRGGTRPCLELKHDLIRNVMLYQGDLKKEKEERLRLQVDLFLNRVRTELSYPNNIITLVGSIKDAIKEQDEYDEDNECSSWVVPLRGRLPSNSVFCPYFLYLQQQQPPANNQFEKTTTVAVRDLQGIDVYFCGGLISSHQITSDAPQTFMIEAKKEFLAPPQNDEQNNMLPVLLNQVNRNGGSPKAVVDFNA